MAVAAVAGLAVGLGLAVAGVDRAADAVWAVLTAALLVPLTLSVVRTLVARRVGVDAIALLAMATALALGEFLAGAVVAVMLSGGNALEAAAGRRARADLSRLVRRAPRHAVRVAADGSLEEVPADAVAAGDVVLVRAGELVPVDGRVEGDDAVLDESALTGESRPVSRSHGEAVRSGVANAGDGFRLRATRPASESAYAALVRLVAQAESERAPFVRMADRYAVVLLAVTVVTALGAWSASGDPVRALAVLVVATPCPLILAAPIAFVSGVSRAARYGVVVKGGAVIERLSRTRTVLMDKTGTLTAGAPAVDRVVSLGEDMDADAVLGVAAALEQHSAHVLAGAVTREARTRGVVPPTATGIRQDHGLGVRGAVGGATAAVGNPDWLVDDLGVDPGPLRTIPGDPVDVAVALDGRVVGAIILRDPLRPDAAEAVRRLRAGGVREVAMVTGDRREVAEGVAARVGITAVHAECDPEEKLAVVRAARAREDGLVAMVGDGVNDAPALVLADVGIAMSTPGATIASDSADAVVMVDRVDRVADLLAVSRRATGIARQSVLAGMGLSLAAMGVAAAGYLTPVAGALVQEAIDVAVILNALRALRD